MGYQQIIINTNSQQAEILEDIFWNLGALSTSFVDNKDNPIFEPPLGKTILWEETNLIVLFDEKVIPELIISILKENHGFNNLKYKIIYIEDKDWTREWMVDYKTMKFGNRLYVCPTTETVEDLNAVVVKLDPGLAFGTGTHNTTRLCLQELDSICLKDKIVIDYGCGSGILGIAAVMLGAKKAICIDIDEQALDATAYNAKNNNVLDKIEMYLVDNIPTNLIKQADVLVSNILAGPLIELSSILETYVKDNGIIILSGILIEKSTDVVNAYSKHFNLKPRKDDEDWCCLIGIKK